ncbi:hypothetical protein KY290_013863 [Solanum tuberosum]|uniref:Late embryogenesis abundant protein LEA-2 subgroup domain-containing protein n=1 Tax=Solanum tuberosum TaxID=4113 RepID=A0ABQ7VMY5_SOLTU|nr:hypothetical protein KY289_013973 [Solanum tuberosum]KAH0769882.1 hypothetical protein KY290_013863 [Solanum tuberosum]
MSHTKVKIQSAVLTRFQKMSPNSSMTESRDQVRPLAPASHRIYVENKQGIDSTSVCSMELAKKQRRRRCIKCCSCCGITIIIIVVIIIIRAFTVFTVKKPTIRINSIKFDGLSYLTSSSNLQTNVNITVFADISIKNPNAVSFKFNRATTRLIYDDRVIVEVLTPSANARARRTFRMIVNVTIMADKLSGIPRLASDLMAGKLTMSMSTSINGRVKILSIKKSVGIQMNCSMVVVLQTQDVKDMDCKRKISL